MTLKIELKRQEANGVVDLAMPIIDVVLACENGSPEELELLSKHYFGLCGVVDIHLSTGQKCGKMKQLGLRLGYKYDDDEMIGGRRDA